MYSDFMSTRVSERGQVTIPKAVRDRLGLEPGTELEFAAQDGQLVGRKRSQRSPVDALYGILELDGGTDEAIHRLRGAADGLSS